MSGGARRAGGSDAAGPARPALVALAAVALACALGWSHGFLDPLSLGLVTLSAAATVAALLLGRGGAARPADGEHRWATRILAAGVAASLVYDAIVPPGYYVPEGTLGTLRPLLAVAALAVATWAWRGAPAAVVRLRFPAVLALFAAMGALVIVRVPEPAIDVWFFQQMGSSALAEGIDPYRVAYPNIYGPDTTNYARELLSLDRRYVLGNPYPPFTLLLGLPAAALQLDVRWLTLAVIVLSAWTIRRLGHASTLAELSAVFLLLQPRTLFVLEQSWTEPTVLGCALLALLVTARWLREDAASASGTRGWIPAGLAGGLALASKQYAPLVLLPLLFALPGRGRWKAAALGVATVAAITAPFVLWHAEAFHRSVIAFQIAQPFRGDALSWLSAVVRLGGPVLPVWPAFLLAGAILALGVRRGISLDQAVLAGGGAWLALVLFNKQAFCNYYWLAVGLLCTAAALCSARGAARQQVRDEPHAASAA